MLKNTERIVNQLLSEGLLSSIAIRVGKFDKVLGEVYASNINPPTKTTLFDMASVTKILSVTAISLISINKGILKLTDKVNDFFPVDENYKDLTVYNLLTHTMGIGHRNLTQNGNSYDNIADYILSLKGNGVNEHVEYSCPAFILMGKILEKIYNKKLDVLFKEMVAVPLKMERSGFCPDTKLYTDIVNSNSSMSEIGIVNDYNCKYLGGVAGNAGIFSCISDMTEFVNALLNDGKPLFSKAIMDIACKNYTQGMEESRGIGFLYVDDTYEQTGDLFPVGSIGHCGHTGQSIFLNRESGLYVIILSDATISTVKKYGREDYQKVIDMRKNIHTAIKKDLTQSDLVLV